MRAPSDPIRRARERQEAIAHFVALAAVALALLAVYLS